MNPKRATPRIACAARSSARRALQSLLRGELLDKGLAQALLMFRRELSARGGEVKHVDRGLAFGVNQRDVDIAFLLCENGADAVQESRLILRNDLNQRAARGTFIVKLNLRCSGNFGGLIFFHFEALPKHALEIAFSGEHIVK